METALAMAVWLSFVSTGSSTPVPKVCTNVTVGAGGESSPLYPVAEDNPTELVLYVAKEDFNSTRVFWGSECFVQLHPLGSAGARDCLVVHPVEREIALVFERSSSALAVFERKGCSINPLGQTPFPSPSPSPSDGTALRVDPEGHSVVISYNCFEDTNGIPKPHPAEPCAALLPWVLTCFALAVALLSVMLACPLRRRVQGLSRSAAVRGNEAM